MAPYFSASPVELRQRSDVAVHGKDAVGDEQLVAGFVLDFVQQLLGVRDVLVTKNLDFGAREACAVDDAGVVQLVGDDEVFFAEDRRNRPSISREARLEDDAGLHVLEARDLLLQLHVNTHGAGDGAHRARAHAILLRRLQSGFAQLGVRCQPEVVVGSEVDDLLAVEGAHRPLLILQHTQLEVRAFLLQVVELVGEEGERVGASGGGCHESPRNKPTF